MKKIAVFASGNGSNFQALIDAVANNELHVNVELLVCDKEGAYVLDRASKNHIATLLCVPKDFPTKDAYEAAILAELEKKEVDYLILAGYMRLIGPTLLQNYRNKIINIHPSLLPDFPGKDAIGQAMAAGVSHTGVTIHYVDEGMDTGPIIAQQRIAIENEDTAESLTRRIQEVEHQLYPSTLEKLLNERN